jgi:hypothetical protein
VLACVGSGSAADGFFIAVAAERERERERVLEQKKSEDALERRTRSEGYVFSRSEGTLVESTQSSIIGAQSKRMARSAVTPFLFTDK